MDTATNGKRTDELELVTFLLGNEQYGLDIMSVQEIIRMPELTRAPQSPDFLAGILNLRGQVLPVIDLRRRMGMVRVAHDKRTRVVIVSRSATTFGLVVDAVADVLRLRAADIQLPPSVARNDEGGMVSGVARMANDRLLLVLDLSVVLPGLGMEEAVEEAAKEPLRRPERQSGREPEWDEAPALAPVIPLAPVDDDAPRRRMRRAA